MVDEEIRAGWEAGRTTWPAVKVTEEAFARYLDALGGARTHLADLYLACALCRSRSCGDRRLRRGVLGGHSRGRDAGGAVRRRANRHPAARPRAPLRRYGRESTPHSRIHWTRRAPELDPVIASRAAVKASIRSAREEPFAPESLAPMLGVSTAPELDYLRRLYLGELRAALAEAFGRLTVGERNLLRHAFVEGLTVDAIGALYKVHRATSARWIVAAHALLVTRTKAALRSRLDLSEQECERILRLLQSQCDITLDRNLQPV